LQFRVKRQDAHRVLLWVWSDEISRSIFFVAWDKIRNIPAVLGDRTISCYIRSLFLYALDKEGREII
jgi:hypothetical protein